MKKWNMASLTFYMLNFIFLLALIYQAYLLLNSNHITWAFFGLSLLFGFLVLPVLLIPVHELIHILAYKVLGAKKIKFGADLSQFIFYVTADRFVTGFRELIFIALLPFFMLSGLLLSLFFVFDAWISFSFLCALFAHGTMCIGDFAMLSFFLENEPSDLLTFDNVDEKKAYFYKRRK
ncbi:MAG: hypothetical protein DRI73_02155 [Bacteroidetes bacterium]|nr:MAG: hypothetical protein DRI73_02155 [Bacteroidota bacterium]